VGGGVVRIPGSGAQFALGGGAAAFQAAQAQAGGVARSARSAGCHNVAFASQWDNYPGAVNVSLPEAVPRAAEGGGGAPRGGGDGDGDTSMGGDRGRGRNRGSTSTSTNATASTVWVLVSGSTNPMQTSLANAVLRFHYAGGAADELELTPPSNFWSMCPYGSSDYDYTRDAFCLPRQPPATVQLGTANRAVVYAWALRQGAVLAAVELEVLSQEVVIGIVAVSVVRGGA
jgi:hypothetical protein